MLGIALEGTEPAGTLKAVVRTKRVLAGLVRERRIEVWNSDL